MTSANIKHSYFVGWKISTKIFFNQISYSKRVFVGANFLSLSSKGLHERQATRLPSLELLEPTMVGLTFDLVLSASRTVRFARNRLDDEFHEGRGRVWPTYVSLARVAPFCLPTLIRFRGPLPLRSSGMCNHVTPCNFHEMFVSIPDAVRRGN